MTPNQLPPLSDEQFPDFLTDTDVARIFRHVYGGQQFDSTERMFSAEVEAAVRAKFREALAALAQQAQPVANDRDCPHCNYTGSMHCGDVAKTHGGILNPEDCSHTKLFGSRITTPPAPQPAPVDEREAVNMAKARAVFESISKCSHNHQRSARGTYRNPPVARDWKWFQLGIYHATEGDK